MKTNPVTKIISCKVWLTWRCFNAVIKISVFNLKTFSLCMGIQRIFVFVFIKMFNHLQNKLSFMAGDSHNFPLKFICSIVPFFLILAIGMRISQNRAQSESEFDSQNSTYSLSESPLRGTCPWIYYSCWAVTWRSFLDVHEVKHTHTCAQTLTHKHFNRHT